MKIVTLGQISFSKFESFLDSLTIENDTWALDVQSHPSRKAFYDGHVHHAMVVIDDDEVVGFCSYVICIDYMNNHPQYNPEHKTNILDNFYFFPLGIKEPSVDSKIAGCLYSYVVKKSHWGRGIGKKLLSTTMYTYTKIITRDVECNQVIHLARTHLHNKGSRGMLKALNYQETSRDEKQVIYSCVFDTSSGNEESYKQIILKPKSKEKKMKIQFIITGWHFNQNSLIDGLSELEQENDFIDVFWSCHREPPQNIKDSFNYKVFHNGGEECGAYDQAVDYLNLDDDTICFFMHDDLIIKDWSFMNICLERLQKFKIIGNGMDYPDNFNPFEKTEIGISEEFDGKQFKDYVKPENQHLFDKQMPILKVRPSFICMKYGDVKLIGGFEPRTEALIPPIVEKDEWNKDGEPHYRGAKGLGSYGNLFPALVCYKMNKVLGTNSISYLSDRYLDSDYIYELGRGELDPNNPIT